MSADELLQMALEELEVHGDRSSWFLIEEIRAYLAAPKKPMTDFREYFEEMRSQLEEDYGGNAHIFEAGFKEGARWVQMDHSPFRRKE